MQRAVSPNEQLQGNLARFDHWSAIFLSLIYSFIFRFGSVGLHCSIFEFLDDYMEPSLGLNPLNPLSPSIKLQILLLFPHISYRSSGEKLLKYQ